MDDAEFKSTTEKIHLADIDELERKFATGEDDNAALHALFLCLLIDHPVPKWARDVFVNAYLRGLHGRLESRSWNEVFGRPPRTKAQMTRFMRDLRAPKEIWLAVAEAKDRGEPIDNHLFEKVGGKFGLSSTETKKRYALWCKQIGKPEGRKIFQIYRRYSPRPAD